MQHVPATSSIHQVLWTSGWDSTFRILDLVLVQRAPVQPIYLVIRERPSAALEMAHMDLIREKLAERCEAAAGRLLPTRYYAKDDLKHHEGIKRAFWNMRRESYLGEQYEWLARLVTQESLEGVELCVHADDLFVDFVEHSDFAIFKCFALPIMHMTKLDMAEYARDHGFHDLLELTWFCHDPVDGRPCGVCAPCRYTRSEGLERRVPAVGPARGLYRRFRRKVVRLFRLSGVI
jgi:hypothetical protein